MSSGPGWSTLPGLWRPGEPSLRLLADHLRASIEHTLTQFGQDMETGSAGAILRDEERRFTGLLSRGRKVLAQLNSGRPLTPADLLYLHQTHGLPPELVTELLAGRGETNVCALGQ